jgi:hypothetical protein
VCCTSRARSKGFTDSSARNAGEERAERGAASFPRSEFAQDLARANDPQYCIDYVGEIMNTLIESEAKLMPSATYMDTVHPARHA